MAGTLGYADPANDPSTYNASGFALPPPQPAADLVNPQGGVVDPLGTGQATGPTGERRPVIDGKKNPLKALGAILLNTAAGMNGRPLYTDQLRKMQQEDDALELQRTQVGAGLLAQATRLLTNTPAANREAVAKQFGALYEHLVPGFGNILKDVAANPDATAAQIQALGEHAQLAVATFGDVDSALKGMAAHPEIVKQWDKQAGERNRPYIMQAFNRVGQMVQQNPQANTALAAAAKDGWTLSDLSDPQVAEAFGLTPEYIRTIGRDPELQSALRDKGFIPTEDQDLKAKKAIEQTPLSRIGQEASTRAMAETNAQPVTYVDGEGNQKLGTFGDRTRMESLGYHKLITGRTQQDAEDAAASRVTGKDQGKRDSKITPYLAQITGKDPNMTNQEFIDAGGNPDIDPTTTRDLQNTEASLKNAQSIIGNVKSIVEANPDANTRVASLQRVASNLTAEYDAFARATGAKSPDFEKEANKYKAVFEENGIDNALMQQAAVSLAYMQSATFGQSGHSASDRDIKLSAEAIGAKSSNPKLLTRMLDQAEVNFDDAYRNKVESVTRIRPVSKVADIANAEKLGARYADGEKITQDEINALPPRALLKFKTLVAAGRTKKAQ